MQAIRECIHSVTSQEGWNLGRLAEELGIHRESLSRLRSGEIDQPKFPVVAKLFKLANRSLDQLVGIDAGGAGPLGAEERRELDVYRGQLSRAMEQIERYEDLIDMIRRTGSLTPEAQPAPLTANPSPEQQAAIRDTAAARRRVVAAIEEGLEELARLAEEERATSEAGIKDNAS